MRGWFARYAPTTFRRSMSSQQVDDLSSLTLRFRIASSSSSLMGSRNWGQHKENSTAQNARGFNASRHYKIRAGISSESTGRISTIGVSYADELTLRSVWYLSPFPLVTHCCGSRQVSGVMEKDGAFEATTAMGRIVRTGAGLEICSPHVSQTGMN